MCFPHVKHLLKSSMFYLVCKAKLYSFPAVLKPTNMYYDNIYQDST